MKSSAELFQEALELLNDIDNTVPEWSHDYRPAADGYWVYQLPPEIDLRIQYILRDARLEGHL